MYLESDVSAETDLLSEMTDSGVLRVASDVMLILTVNVMNNDLLCKTTNSTFRDILVTMLRVIFGCIGGLEKVGEMRQYYREQKRSLLRDTKAIQTQPIMLLKYQSYLDFAASADGTSLSSGSMFGSGPRGVIE